MKSKLMFMALIIMMLLLLVGCSNDDNAQASSDQSVSIVVDDGFAEIEDDNEKIDAMAIVADEIACDIFFVPFAPNIYDCAINLDTYYYCYDYEYDGEFIGKIAVSTEDENKCLIAFDEDNYEFVELFKKNDSWFVKDSSLDKYRDENLNDLYRTSQIISYDIFGSFDEIENEGEVDIDGVACHQFLFEYEMVDTGSVAIAKDFSKHYVRYADSEEYIPVAKQFGNWLEYNGFMYDSQIPSDDTYKNKAIELCKEHLGEYTDIYFEYSFVYNDHHYFSYSLYNDGSLLGIIAVSTDGGPDMVDRERDSTFEDF